MREQTGGSSNRLTEERDGNDPEVAPVPWTPQDGGERSPRWEEKAGRTRRSSLKTSMTIDKVVNGHPLAPAAISATISSALESHQLVRSRTLCAPEGGDLCE